MKHTFEIPTPESITIGQFLAFHKAKTDIKRCTAATGKTAEELSDVPLIAVKRAVSEFREMVKLIEEVEFPRIITIDGQEYGFEPNLNRIQTSAWADIAHLEDIGRDEHLHEILSILYRPITQRWGIKDVKYRIEDYAANRGDSIDNANLFLDYKMSHALNVLGFFLSLQQGCMISSERKMMTALSDSIQEMKKEILPT